MHQTFSLLLFTGLTVESESLLIASCLYWHVWPCWDRLGLVNINEQLLTMIIIRVSA